MEGMEQMKQALEKEGSKAANPVNNTGQGEEEDMVKVGGSVSLEAVENLRGTSKSLKRKLLGADAEHKVLKLIYAAILQ